MLEFFLPMNPPTTTAQQHRAIARKGKKTVFFDSPALAEARAKLTAHLGQRRPPGPIEGPVRLTVKWCFPRVAGHRHGEWKLSRPDTDNLQKLLKDVMTRLGFWSDDAHVVSEIAEKFWSDTPGIFIKIEVLA